MLGRKSGFKKTSSIDNTNPHTRLAICLCLDTSGSMNYPNSHPINELNAGIRMFYDTIKNDTESRRAADISIVTFGGYNEVKCMQEFSQVYEAPTPPSLSALGNSPIGEAVNMALDMIEARRAEYQEAGISYYHPWLVLMTDGEPNGSAEELERAINRVAALVNERRLAVFPIGIGKEANMEVLAKLSPKRKPMSLVGLNFRGFFEWLSRSVGRQSVSQPGEIINLPPIDGGWGTL